jgi:hypothetical protein
MKLQRRNICFKVNLDILNYFLVDFKFGYGALTVVQQNIINRIIFKIFEHFFEKFQIVGSLSRFFLSQFFDPSKSTCILIIFCVLSL